MVGWLAGTRYCADSHAQQEPVSAGEQGAPPLWAGAHCRSASSVACSSWQWAVSGIHATANRNVRATLSDRTP